MPWLTRKALVPSLPHTEVALVRQTLQTLTPHVDALTQHLPQHLIQQTVTPFLHRLVTFCWDLPASEAHHHSGAFGLITHSLDVAAHALVAFAQSSVWWTKAPDPAQRHRMHSRWLVGTALAGLLHDMGKVFDVTVEVVPPPGEGVSAWWHPLHEALLPFLLRQSSGPALPEAILHWQPGRGMRHEAAGALVATLLLTRDDLVTLSLPVARELWAFLGGAPDPANVFRQLISQPPPQATYTAADGHSVRADRHVIPPAHPTMAARVLATLTQCCREGPLRVNQFPGQVFVLDDQTLVVVPEGFKPVRERLAQDGVTVPGGAVLYNDLAEAGYLLGTAGQNVARAVFQRDGRRPVPLSVLRLPHALLWGAAPPPPFAGHIELELPNEGSPTMAPSLTSAPAAKE
jgi:hypothetical protein